MRESGRFQLMEKPNAFPFKEIINGTPEGPVFDIGVDLEMYDGVIYIKAEHVTEMAEQLGMATKEEVAELHGKIDKLSSEVEVLPTRIGAFTDELAELVDRFHTSLDTDVPSVALIQESEAIIEQPKSDDKEPRKSDGQEFGFDLIKGFDDFSASTGNESTRNKSGTKG